jgi:hypothetical protein
MTGYVSKKNKEDTKKYPELGVLIEIFRGLWKIKIALWFVIYEIYIIPKDR